MLTKTLHSQHVRRRICYSHWHSHSSDTQWDSSGADPNLWKYIFSPRKGIIEGVQVNRQHEPTFPPFLFDLHISSNNLPSSGLLTCRVHGQKIETRPANCACVLLNYHYTHGFPTGITEKIHKHKLCLSIYKAPF